MASIPATATNNESTTGPVVKPGCVFCNVSEERGFKIVLKEGDIVVFKDRSPAAQEHLLVVPLNHIDGVKDLTGEHIPLIQEMEAAGHRALDQLSDAYPRDKRLLNSNNGKLEDLEAGGGSSQPVAKFTCAFCNVSQERGFEIVLREGNVVVFHDRDPAARVHLQVVPIQHGALNSVKDLRASDIPLLREMERAGYRALDMLPDRVPSEKPILGFHIPPFTSVSHLHLHVHGLPYKALRRYKYPIALGRNGQSKGMSYFVTISQAIEILEKGRKITLSAC